MGNPDIIHVMCGKKGKWYYRIENGDNRQVLATSQTYSKKRVAIRMAEALQARHPTFDVAIDE